MQKVLKVLFVLCILWVFFPFPAFAGGGPIGIDESFPLVPFNQTHAFVVGVSIYAPKCDQLDVKATLEDKTDGDTVNTYTPPDDGTFIERHYISGYPQNVWTKICKRYFKITSATPKQRTFVAEVTVDGDKAKATYPVAFGDDEYSQQLQTMARPLSGPEIDIISEKSLGGGKREVKVQWNKVPGVQKYAVYARELIDNGQQIEVTPFGDPLMTTTDTKATLNVASNLDFNLSAVACYPDTCAPPEYPYEALLSKTQPGTISMNHEEIAKTLPPVILTPTSNPNNDKVEALNKKVAALENKLEESNKKQNVLEERLSQLLTFIRSLFPNFQKN